MIELSQQQIDILLENIERELDHINDTFHENHGNRILALLLPKEFYIGCAVTLLNILPDCPEKELLRIRYEVEKEKFLKNK